MQRATREFLIETLFAGPSKRSLARELCARDDGALPLELLAENNLWETSWQTNKQFASSEL
jgi:hypothetical protein